MALPIGIYAVGDHRVTVSRLAGRHEGQTSSACTCGWIEVAVTTETAIEQARQHAAGHRPTEATR